MPSERGSEYSPTFVYRRKDKKKKKKKKGKTKERIPPIPVARDLHIVFSEGGVTVEDKGNAERSDRKNTKGNEAHFTFPPFKPIKAADSINPPPKPKDGDDVPSPPPPPPESSCNPTFTHAKPNFPNIREWWWTHTKLKKKKWVNYDGPHHKGNPTGWEHE